MRERLMCDYRPLSAISFGIGKPKDGVSSFFFHGLHKFPPAGPDRDRRIFGWLTLVIDQTFDVSHDFRISLIRCFGHTGQVIAKFIVGRGWLGIKNERHGEKALR